MQHLPETRMEKLAVINKYLKPVFARVSTQVQRNRGLSHIFCDGRTMFMVSDRALYKVDQHKHDLVGVYNKMIETEDLRDDLCWYALNYLEEQQ